MNKVLFILLLLFLSHRGAGQVDTLAPREIEVSFLEELLVPDTLSGGSARLEGDARVNLLVELMTGVNRRRFSFTGYRVQILSANASRVKLDSLQRYVARFEEYYPGTRAYLQYTDPDFKVRVGNFRSKIEAIPLLKKVRRRYPSSYIVKETILLKELLDPVPEEETGGEDVLMDSF
ncbi:MAG: SPOR domain-containing protein [Odoribacteraceae bacterium]|jgi:hypothetical protein|nr:SPOR domain-containing protein [Odoribacteraceae bacterium]